MRLIDADAVISGVKNRCIGQNDVVKVEHSIISMIYMIPTIDAVPVDFLKSISSRMYGKERFFKQTNGTWYDRYRADYISLEEMMDRIYQQIVELDDCIDAEPVRHGKWIEYPIADGMNQCSVCGVLRFGESNYCPNCGARMDEE